MVTPICGLTVGEMSLQTRGYVPPGPLTSGSLVVSFAACTRVKHVCSKIVLFWIVTRDGWPARPAGLKIVASGSDARATHAPPRAICSEPLSGNSVTLLARAEAGKTSMPAVPASAVARTRSFMGHAR